MVQVDLRHKNIDMALPNFLTFCSIVFTVIFLKISQGVQMFIQIAPEVVAFLAAVASISTVAMNVYRGYQSWKRRKQNKDVDA